LHGDPSTRTVAVTSGRRHKGPVYHLVQAPNLDQARDDDTLHMGGQTPPWRQLVLERGGKFFTHHIHIWSAHAMDAQHYIVQATLADRGALTLLYELNGEHPLTRIEVSVPLVPLEFQQFGNASRRTTVLAADGHSPGQVFTVSTGNDNYPTVADCRKAGPRGQVRPFTLVLPGIERPFGLPFVPLEIKELGTPYQAWLVEGLIGDRPARVVYDHQSSWPLRIETMAPLQPRKRS
jgi:hypothetical protein